MGENIAVKSMAERKCVPRSQYFRKQKNWETNIRWVLHVAYMTISYWQNMEHRERIWYKTDVLPWMKTNDKEYAQKGILRDMEKLWSRSSLKEHERHICKS